MRQHHHGRCKSRQPGTHLANEEHGADGIVFFNSAVKHRLPCFLIGSVEITAVLDKNARQGLLLLLQCKPERALIVRRGPVDVGPTLAEGIQYLGLAVQDGQL